MAQHQPPQPPLWQRQMQVAAYSRKPDANPRPTRPAAPRVGKAVTASEHELWLAYLLDMMRHDLREAEKASDRWERRKDLIQERWGGDLVNLRCRAKEDVLLADHMDAWSFFERRAKLYAETLQAELAYVNNRRQA